MNRVAKRIIFTLLFSDNNFYLSRNFTLQKVGDIKWLKKNYDFQKLLFSVDELIILNVDREKKEIRKLSNCLKEISKDCFIPITAGGGIENIKDAKFIFRSGADKILFNTGLINNKKLVNEIANIYGEQSIIASIDVKIENRKYCVYINNGKKKINIEFKKYLKEIENLPIGEILLNSIDRDGTGFGLDLNLIKFIKNFKKPIILSGGLGKKEHFLDCLKNYSVDAVSTANLLNFLGSALYDVRKFLYKYNLKLANWKL